MSIEHCKLQAFGVFTFMWQFVLHLTICVFAYGRILLVLRRQGKVMPTQRRNTAVAAKESVAGSRRATTEMIHVGATSGTTKRIKNVTEGKAKAGDNSQSHGGQGGSTGLSKAKVNVIRTMIFIIVCYGICLFPKDFDAFYKTLTVLNFFFL